MPVSTSPSHTLVHRPKPSPKKLPPTPPPHAAPGPPPGSHEYLTTHQHTDSPLLNLPTELLILITDTLDQPTLELLRRVSPLFLRALPAIYPRLFSPALQGFFPWPVRRPWTLKQSQRREVLRLVARGGSLYPAPVTEPVIGHPEEMRVVRCGSMLGLKKEWRYIPCVDCGRIHPSRGVVTP